MFYVAIDVKFSRLFELTEAFSRFNQMRPDFLKKISKIASYDWAAKGFPIPKEHFADGNTWNSVNLSGRREGPLYVEEPDFVLVKEEPHTDLLGITLITLKFLKRRIEI